MAIGGGTEKAFIASGTDATSYTTSAGAWTPVSGRFYLAWVENTKSTTPDIPTFSGNGITWTRVGTALASAARRLSCFAATGTGGTSGESTADFAGNTQTGGAISVQEFTGVDTSSIATSPGAGKTVVQVPTGTSSTGTTGTVTLSAAGDANNRAAVAFIHNVNEVATPRASWTEVSDRGHPTPTLAMETQWRSDSFETTASATWATSGSWLGLAIEMLATLGGSGGDGAPTDFFGGMPI